MKIIVYKQPGDVLWEIELTVEADWPEQFVSRVDRRRVDLGHALFNLDTVNWFDRLYRVAEEKEYVPAEVTTHADLPEIRVLWHDRAAYMRRASVAAMTLSARYMVPPAVGYLPGYTEAELASAADAFWRRVRGACLLLKKVVLFWR